MKIKSDKKCSYTLTAYYVKYKFLKKWSDLSPLDFGLVCTDMFGPKTCTW